MTFAIRLAARRKECGYSQATLAKAVKEAGGKLSQQNVANLERGHVKRTGAIEIIARILETTSEWLMDGAGAPPLPPRKLRSLPAQLQPLVADLPVYPTYGRHDGLVTMMIEIAAGSRTERPPPLREVTGAFAFYNCDTYAAPAVDVGELCFVNPLLPPRQGDLVIFMAQRTGESGALVRRYLSATEDRWHIIQHTPHKRTQLPRNEWPVCFVVVGRFSGR